MSWMLDYSSLLLGGLRTTLSLLLIALIFGFILAVLVALARLSRYRILSLPALAFTSVIRGTPLLVQIYVFYYGLGSILSHSHMIRTSFIWPYLRDGYWYVAVTLILSCGAYIGEIIRGGLLAVPKGEIEAARAFGMGKLTVLARVQLPRAFYQILPTLAGESVMTLKSTALASVIAVVDLLGAANQLRSITFNVYQPLLLVAVIYIIVTFIIERLFATVEKRVQVMRPH